MRREAEDLISQRVFSILLAAHAAEAFTGEDPRRLARILELIRGQSAAALDDMRLLASLR